MRSDEVLKQWIPAFPGMTHSEYPCTDLVIIQLRVEARRTGCISALAQRRRDKGGAVVYHLRSLPGSLRLMQRVSMKMALVLVVVGLLLGPGYYVYQKFYTGRILHSIPLAPASDGFQPASFVVGPEFGPIRIVLRASADHDPVIDNTPPRLRYTAEVRAEPGATASFPVEFVATSIESEFREFTAEIATLPVAQATTYHVSLRQVEPSGMSVRSAVLEIRGDVSEPDMRLVWGGVLLLGTGALLLVL